MRSYYWTIVDYLDSSWSCEIMDMGPVCRTACLFTRESNWYSGMPRC